MAPVPQMAKRLLITAVLMLCLPYTARPNPSAASQTHWLDGPLNGWNRANTTPPHAPASLDAVAALRARCPMPSSSIAAHRAVEAAGWIAYDHLDRVLERDGTTVVAGLSAADQACAALNYQLFVFRADRFIGTLAPTLIVAAHDGAAGTVRLLAGGGITVEFARYTGRDPSCCPSSRVEVRYGIEGSDAFAVVVPTGMRTIRGS